MSEHADDEAAGDGGTIVVAGAADPGLTGTIRLGERRNGTRRLHVRGPVTDTTLRELERCARSASRRGADQVLVVLDSGNGEIDLRDVERLSVALGDLPLPVHVVPPSAV